jgi:DNA-binding LacI/PurR family transcriptional regulator
MTTHSSVHEHSARKKAAAASADARRSGAGSSSPAGTADTTRPSPVAMQDDSLTQSADVPETTGHPAASVTIRTIAREAGVSPSTVSRTFSRPGRVNSATARKIRSVADRLGYHRQEVTADSYDSAFNGLIGIVVADISNPVFSELMQAAQHACQQNNYGLITIDTQESATVERVALHRALRHIDGIVLASSRMADNSIYKLASLRPLVSINRSIRGVQTVIGDVTQGMEDALDQLVAAGHRSITYLSGPAASWQDGVRWKLLGGLCAKKHLYLHRINLVSPTFEMGHGAIQQFAEHPTTAVIAYNDMLALGFLTALKERSVHVPQEVSVIGIDDIPYSALVTPSLSTIALPRRQMGAIAVQKLLERVTEPTSRLKNTNLTPILLPSRYIPRQSTGPAPALPPTIA